MIYRLSGLTGHDRTIIQELQGTRSWKALVRSAKGTTTRQTPLHCYDAGQYRVFDAIIVGAIASGLETAPYGDLGSKLAVEMIVDELLIQVRSEGGQWHKPVLPRVLKSERAATHLFTPLVKQVREGLQIQAGSNEYDVNHLACTLMAFVATPFWMAALHIGGGLLVVRSVEGSYQVLFPDSEVQTIDRLPLTHPQALSTLQVCVYPQPLSFLCAATPPLIPVALQSPDRTPFSPFFQPLEDYIRDTPVPEEDASYLVEFLNSESLQSRVSTDRTILLGCYQTLREKRPEENEAVH
ncbi:MAG: protein phosphatase 2C domain-containing protein [Leptolyngbyaceae cyanobacterium bins.59]|nr:protein phosphatase 2C domain-containing protein [Leptolyngbyaceae cyanobacterium bins.59]